MDFEYKEKFLNIFYICIGATVYPIPCIDAITIIRTVNTFL